MCVYVRVRATPAPPRAEQKAKDAREQANRWTDNVFVAKSWVSNKFGGQYNEKAFNQQMGIPNDLDYLD